MLNGGHRGQRYPRWFIRLVFWDQTHDSDSDITIGIEIASDDPDDTSVARASTYLRDAPRNLDNVIAAILDLVDRLHDTVSARPKELALVGESCQQFAAKDLCMTSGYSGFGTDFIAGLWISKRLWQRFLPAGARLGQLTTYSGNDIEQQCRHALGEHSAATRPRHMFRDLNDRMFPSDRCIAEQIIAD